SNIVETLVGAFGGGRRGVAGMLRGWCLGLAAIAPLTTGRRPSVNACKIFLFRRCRQIETQLK
ncbi:hypothetical protein, partial [Klebsiella aerogenes]|uniref:hypothetical protein n=1 Tax=Klebsiella aerogenes TaxID=548 RepID=UPI001953C31E